MGGVEGAKLQGAAPNDKLGRSLGRPGDVDGDGFSDLLVGASDADGGAGTIYVVLGGAYGVDVDSSGDNGWTDAVTVRPRGF